MRYIHVASATLGGVTGSEALLFIYISDNPWTKTEFSLTDTCPARCGNPKATGWVLIDRGLYM